MVLRGQSRPTREPRPGDKFQFGRRIRGWAKRILVSFRIPAPGWRTRRPRSRSIRARHGEDRTHPVVQERDAVIADLSKRVAEFEAKLGANHQSALYPALRHLDLCLARWAMSKYRRLKRHRRRARRWLREISLRDPALFAHWQWLHRDDLPPLRGGAWRLGADAACALRQDRAAAPGAHRDPGGTLCGALSLLWRAGGGAGLGGAGAGLSLRIVDRGLGRLPALPPCHQLQAAFEAVRGPPLG